ncbi:MAG TPA: hypothetical protein VG275_00270 [Solirubrobacteraceae bacterium]|nr:hypothetical protein [Solirubrobacteraceae bacterium]
MAWKLTVRADAKVEKSRYDRIEDALDALEARARELAQEAPGRTVDVKIRRFEPAEQVVGRLELSGPERLLPKVRAGVDVRGDGSTAAYLGRVTREVLAEGRGERPFRALRRALATSGASG